MAEFEISDEMKARGWRHETDIYAESFREQPAWAVSLSLGVCPMVCPDHGRHCVHLVGEDHDHRCALDAPPLATPEDQP